MITAEEFLSRHGVPADDVQRTPPAHERNGRRRSGAGRDADRPKRRGAGFGYTVTDQPDDEEACKEAALRLLDAAARSSGSLRGKLTERGYAPETIDAVIDRLTELRLLDDEDYARMVVRSCIARMMGMRGAVMELTRKGVDRSLAQSVAREAADQGAFEEAAWELGRSVARKTRTLDPQTRKRRFWSAGGRKGHDPQTLRDVAYALFTDHGEEEK